MVLSNAQWFAAAGVPATLVFNEVLTDASQTASHTFTSVDFGTAADNRRILISISSNCDTTTFTGTIGGITFSTVVSNLAGGGQAAGLMMATVPTGTSGTVVINHGSTGSVVVGVWSLYDTASSAYDSATDDSDNEADTSGDLDVPANGLVFGVASTGSGSNVTQAWTNATENFDSFSGLNYINGSGASAEVSAADSSLTLTATRTGGSGNTWFAGVFASFGPID